MNKSGTLIVTEAFAAQVGGAAASSYRIDSPADSSALALVPLSRSVGNGRSEMCWAVVTPDGENAFVANFGDGAVSRYRVHPDGTLTLVDAMAGTAVAGHPGLRDMAITADGRYLYVIDTDAHRTFAWSVGSEGVLTELGAWEGIPDTAAGLAAQ